MCKIDTNFYEFLYNLFSFAAFLTSCFVLLNTFWGVIWFNAWDHKNWINIILVVASHLFVSLIVCEWFNLYSNDNNNKYNYDLN